MRNAPSARLPLLNAKQDGIIIPESDELPWFIVTRSPITTLQCCSKCSVYCTETGSRRGIGYGNGTRVLHGTKGRKLLTGIYGVYILGWLTSNNGSITYRTFVT